MYIICCTLRWPFCYSSTYWLNLRMLYTFCVCCIWTFIIFKHIIYTHTHKHTLFWWINLSMHMSITFRLHCVYPFISLSLCVCVRTHTYFSGGALSTFRGRNSRATIRCKCYFYLKLFLIARCDSLHIAHSVLPARATKKHRYMWCVCACVVYMCVILI